MENFNRQVVIDNHSIVGYVDEEAIYSSNYTDYLLKIKGLDHGGFNKEHLSTGYVTLQNHERYKNVRLTGWSNIFRNSLSFSKVHQEYDGTVSIFDFLAGSGTLSQRFRSLYPNSGTCIIGLDISYAMCQKARDLGEVVFWGSHECSPFKSGSGDFAVAAYGLHHVPIEERQFFLKAMQSSLKRGGVCVLHDFEEGSASARWYSEALHNFRSTGHNFQHFTLGSLGDLLDGYFKRVEVIPIYDPFYLDGLPEQNEQELINEFFLYLVKFFCMDRLYYEDINFRNTSYDDYLAYLRDTLIPFFQIEDHKTPIRSGGEVPFVKKLTVQRNSSGGLCLIAPRFALLGLGSDV